MAAESAERREDATTLTFGSGMVAGRELAAIIHHLTNKDAVCCAGSWVLMWLVIMQTV
jgi:hypothetical protein